MELRNILLVVMKGAMADLTLVLPIAAVIIVNVFMRCTTKRADNGFGNSSAVTTVDGFYDLVVVLAIVFDKESIIWNCQESCSLKNTQNSLSIIVQFADCNRCNCSSHIFGILSSSP